MTAAAVGNMLGDCGSRAAAAGTSDAFVREVEDLVRSRTSVLLVRDHGGDLDAVLLAIQRIGTAVLRTNVDMEWAKRVRMPLAGSADVPQASGRSIETTAIDGDIILTGLRYEHAPSMLAPDFARQEEPHDDHHIKRTRPPDLSGTRAGSRDGGRGNIPPGRSVVQRGL
jgi:hypothetical protein